MTISALVDRLCIFLATLMEQPSLRIAILQALKILIIDFFNEHFAFELEAWKQVWQNFNFH